MLVIEQEVDVPAEALEPVDVAPGHIPGAEILLEHCDGFGEHGQAGCGRRFAAVEIHSLHPAQVLRGRVPFFPGKAVKMCQRHRDGIDAGLEIPGSQRIDGIGKDVRRSVGRVISFNETCDQLLKPGHIGVMCQPDQAVERQVIGAGQYLYGVHTPEVLRVGRHVERVVLAPRAEFLRCRERRGIGVLYPAVLRIEYRDDLVDRVNPLPVGRRVAAVDGFGVVELRVAPRHEVAVEVGDISFAVRVDRIVRRVRADVHHVAKPGVARLFSPRI